MIFYKLTFALAAVAVLAPAIAQPVIEKPELKVGDRWTFRAVDLWKNEETDSIEHKVTGLVGDEIEITRTVVSSANTHNVGQSLIRKADRSTWTFVNSSVIEGKFVAFVFPLNVGNTWDYDFKTKNEAGEITTQSRTAKVEAWEDVTVPAGKFKALKVVHNGRWSRLNYSGTVTETFWYSPDAKWWVKREFIDRRPNGAPWNQSRSEMTEIQVQ